MIGFSPRFIIIFITLVVLLFYPLQIVQAAGAIAYILKEFTLDLVARLIARTLLSKMSNGILSTIATAGRDGAPAFIQDWRTFKQSAQYRGEDIFRATIANITQGSSATACSYLRNNLSNAFGAQNKSVANLNPNNYRIDSLQPFKLLTNCTLPPGLDVNAFKNDFSKGGWSAWNQLIQPQNNFYGLYALSSNELDKQRKFEEGVDTSEGESAKGWVGKRDACQGSGSNTKCAILGKVLTPGDVLGDIGSQINRSELDWLTGSDELSEVVLNMTSLLSSRLGNFLGGRISGGPNQAVGSDAQDPAPLIQGARQDCIDACVLSNCPAALPACVDNDGDGLSDNRPCSPDDPDPRQSCTSNCQAQGCN